MGMEFHGISRGKGKGMRFVRFLIKTELYKSEGQANNVALNTYMHMFVHCQIGFKSP